MTVDPAALGYGAFRLVERHCKLRGTLGSH